MLRKHFLEIGCTTPYCMTLCMKELGLSARDSLRSFIFRECSVDQRAALSLCTHSQLTFINTFTLYWATVTPTYMLSLTQTFAHSADEGEHVCAGGSAVLRLTIRPAIKNLTFLFLCLCCLQGPCKNRHFHHKLTEAVMEVKINSFSHFSWNNNKKIWQ